MQKTLILLIAVAVAAERVDAKTFLKSTKEQRQQEQTRYSAWGALSLVVGKGVRALCCAARALSCCPISRIYNDNGDDRNEVTVRVRELDLLSLQGHPDPETPRLFETEFLSELKDGVLCVRVEP